MTQSKIVVDIQNLSKARKSTLIRLITGILKPTTGHVRINQLDRNKYKKRFSEQFGYMPDNFQSSITTKEKISFYAQIKNISKQRYAEVLREVGLLDKLNVKVGNFSKGMNQRLLLAQALLAKPSVLILDEPTNGLDPYWIKQFANLMLHAKKENTQLFSSLITYILLNKLRMKLFFLVMVKLLVRDQLVTIKKLVYMKLFSNFILSLFPIRFINRPKEIITCLIIFLRVNMLKAVEIATYFGFFLSKIKNVDLCILQVKIEIFNNK